MSSNYIKVFICGPNMHSHGYQSRSLFFTTVIANCTNLWTADPKINPPTIANKAYKKII